MTFHRRNAETGHVSILQFAAILAVIFLLTPVGSQAAEPAMKTARPPEAMIVPLFNSIVSFDQAVNANGGRPPKDAIARIKEIQALADRVKPQYRRFAAELKAADEIQSFNDFIAARIKDTEVPSLIAGLRLIDGNAYGILLKADFIIQGEIDARRKELGLASRSNPILELLGIGTAEAGFFRNLASWGCSVSVFTLTLGYASDFNYHGCGV